MKVQENVTILANQQLQGDYYLLQLQTNNIAGLTKPGQFLQLQIANLEHRILRRPFSIYDVNTKTGALSIVYKIVGEGTAKLATLPTNTILNAIGSLGNGFTIPNSNTQAIVVAGGYGCAATYLLAKLAPKPPVILIGGKNKQDLLLLEQYKNLGCRVEVSTDDGSAGYHGLVTALLQKELDETKGKIIAYACGPNPMLKAVGNMMINAKQNAQLSLDEAMCCGVGACFGCVIKKKADNKDGWEYVRSCKDGPVFDAKEIYWD